MASTEINIQSNQNSTTKQQAALRKKKKSNVIVTLSKGRTVRTRNDDGFMTSRFIWNLKCCVWMMPKTTLFALMFGISIITMMTIAILIVYFTAPRPSAPICQIGFKSNTPISIYNYGPRSIAIRDFDNDTLPDMVIANSLNSTIVIYFGDGKDIFSNQISFSTGFDTSPYMVAVGDINKDTHLDIAVANFGTNNIALFLGYGNRSFLNHTPVSTDSSRPIWINLVDLNNDTALDIITADYGTHSISIFYGYGNGTFYSPIRYSTGYDSLPDAVVAGDFNHDNHLDLVTANSGTHTIGLFFSTGNGSFENYRTLSTGLGSCPHSIVVGHFNDDHMLDIAVANYGTNSIGVFFGTGDGTFTSQTNYSTGTTSPYFIDAGDMNQDSRLDLVVAGRGINDTGVYLGSENGTFVLSKMYSTGTGSLIALALFDLNKNNRLDVIAISNDTGAINILLGVYEGFLNRTTHSTGESPSSVAVGDFNNDTRLDIVVANEYSNDVSILIGYGNGSFQEQITYSTGKQPSSVAVGDLNNDTRLDIVVANAYSNNVSILLGYGNGSFHDQITYSTGKYPWSVAVGDLNNDTRLDIVVANYDSTNVGILLGYGDGSFQQQITYSTGLPGNDPRSVALSDFNNDTRLDIVVVNAYSGNVIVLLEYGNGSFQYRGPYLTGGFPWSVAVGDFNNDTRSDIVVTNYYSDNVDVFIQYNRASLQKEITYMDVDVSRVQCVIVVDIHDDTQMDIVVANYSDKTIGFLFGYGNGTFTSPEVVIHNISNADPLLVSIADFNGDTYLDMAMTNGFTRPVDMLIGTGKDTFALQVNYGIDFLFKPCVIIPGDFDNDKRFEIVVGYDGTDLVDVFASYKTGFFPDQITYSTGFHPYSIVVGDFNKDTRLDIIVANSGSDNVSILLGYGNGSFHDQITYLTGKNPSSVVVCDLNNDTRLDIVVANSGSNNVSILLGYGDGSFHDQIPYLTGVHPYSIAVGDFNNDTRLDIVVVNQDSNNVSILLGYGNGSFHDQITYSTGSYPHSIAVGDFNNDTRLDIVVANYESANVSILLGYGNGSFHDQITYSTGNYPSSVAVGDLNNDTRLDIVVANSVSNNVIILLGYRDGSFQQQIKYSAGIWPQSVAVGDFNNDTQLDIVIANSISDNVSILLGKDNQMFGALKQLTSGNNSRPRAFVIQDFNNDGCMDIVAANSRSDNIAIFFGYCNISFTSSVIYSTGPNSSPYSVATTDFNNDTHIDIVVANYDSDNIGTFFGDGNGSFVNYTTYSSGTNPYFVVVADFDNDFILDIIVANYGSNNVVLFRGDGYGSFVATKSIQLKYGSHPISLFVADFNNDKKLDFVVANDDTNSYQLFLQTC